jgi:hypothetical protein
VSREIPGGFVIEEEPSQQCDDCGQVAELRPYGPGGSAVCFDCMQKDEEGAKRRFRALLNGDPNWRAQ